jgi:hypothetical protein
MLFYWRAGGAKYVGFHSGDDVDWKRGCEGSQPKVTDDWRTPFLPGHQAKHTAVARSITICPSTPQLDSLVCITQTRPLTWILCQPVDPYPLNYEKSLARYGLLPLRAPSSPLIVTRLVARLWTSCPWTIYGQTLNIEFCMLISRPGSSKKEDEGENVEQLEDENKV